MDVAATRYQPRNRAQPYLDRENFQGLPVTKTATPESALLDPRAAITEDGERDPR